MKKLSEEKLVEIAEAIGEFCHQYYKGCEKIQPKGIIDTNEWEYSYSKEVIFMLNSEEGLKFLKELLVKLS